MKRNKESLLSLDSENQKSIEILNTIIEKIRLLKKRLKTSSDDEFLWIAMAQLLATYYTLCETILFRCAQSFGNTLEPSKWHKSLLEKMRIKIEGIRPALLTDNAFQHLDNLRRFRHFLRYYHELSLDVEEITLHVKRIDPTHKEFNKCYKTFSDFIRDLADQLE